MATLGTKEGIFDLGGVCARVQERMIVLGDHANVEFYRLIQ